MSQYSELLKHPKWQKKRLEIMNRDEFKCTCCKRDYITLNIHHLKYNGNPWDVDNDFLITLCEDCHQIYEYLKSKGANILTINTKFNGYGIYVNIFNKIDNDLFLEVFFLVDNEDPKSLIIITYDSLISHSEIIKSLYDGK